VADHRRHGIGPLANFGEQHRDDARAAAVEGRSGDRAFPDPAEVLVLPLDIPPLAVLAEDAQALAEVRLVHELRVVARLAADVHVAALHDRVVGPDQGDTRGGGADYAGRDHRSLG